MAIISQKKIETYNKSPKSRKESFTISKMRGYTSFQNAFMKLVIVVKVNL